MKVLITRAEPAASQTAKNLEANGHEAIVMPLFEVVDTGASIPKADYDGILFTSRNAVEVLAKREPSLNNKNIPVFCVGEKTEKAAKAMGFHHTVTTKGGGKVLCDKITAMDNHSGKRFLYPSTQDKSFDMAEALSPFDIKVETADIYRAKAINLDKTLFENLITKVRGNCIFVYSALSSEHLKSLLQTISNKTLSRITLVGISNQAVEPLKNLSWERVLVAKSPTEIDMVRLIS